MSLELTAPAPEEPSVAANGTWLECIAYGTRFTPFEDARYTYDDYDSLLEVHYASPPTWDDFEGHGVWRYNTVLLFKEGISLPEGATSLHEVSRLEADVGVETLRVKHEGMNPAGSSKDHGMTIGVHVAKELGIGHLACVSTGNTSAALATYGTRSGMETLMLLPAGKVAAEKVAQASPHDTRILEVDDNFGSYPDIIRNLAARGEAYLLNSLNPFCLEGQKTIGLEILEESHEDYGSHPDRVVLPVGNAGNTFALYKTFRELVQSGALDVDDVPELTGVQAEGVAPMVEATENGWNETRHWDDVETRAIAIRIGNPVNAPKALPGIREADGTAVAISDEEITAARHDLAAGDVGIKPASAAPVAGFRKPRAEGVIDADEQVVCLMTGHLLKNPDATFEAGDDPEPVPNDTETVLEHFVEQA